MERFTVTTRVPGVEAESPHDAAVQVDRAIRQRAREGWDYEVYDNSHPENWEPQRVTVIEDDEAGESA